MMYISAPRKIQFFLDVTVLLCIWLQSCVGAYCIHLQAYKVSP